MEGQVKGGVDVSDGTYPLVVSRTTSLRMVFKLGHEG